MPSNKDKGKAFYKLSVDLAQKARAEYNRAKVENLEETLGAYLSLLNPVDDPPETIEVGRDILIQMATLASVPLARMISEKYRNG